MRMIIAAGAIGVLPVGRISDNVSVIAESDLPPGAAEKLEAQRREVLREQERWRERARMNGLAHAGERERRRRQRQIERGQLKAQNGLLA